MKSAAFTQRPAQAGRCRLGGEYKNEYDTRFYGTALKSGWITLAAAVLAAFSSSCSTFDAHAGPELPDGQVATLECYWRHLLIASQECHVSGVDGKRPGWQEVSNLTAKLSSGKHWVEVEVSSYFGGGSGTTTCTFEMDFEPGSRYRLIPSSLKTDGGWLESMRHVPRQGSFGMTQETADGSQSTFTVPATCMNGSGAMCRDNSDCNYRPDLICRREIKQSIGRCVFED